MQKSLIETNTQRP